jgi:hypothetical protein
MRIFRVIFVEMMILPNLPYNFIFQITRFIVVGHCRTFKCVGSRLISEVVEKFTQI